MQQNTYQHLFFDLDRTLWDFERNSAEAIEELFYYHKMDKKLGVEFPEFFKVYSFINDELWAQYRKGDVVKDELRQQRYLLSFQHFGYDDAPLALQFNDEYVSTSSSKIHLLPNTLEVLDYLYNKYNLHIITNGFVEAQNVKLDNCNIRKFFKTIIISDGMGFRKPDKRIFHHAMKEAGAKSANSLMIGDDYGPDVIGAKAVGMDQVYLCPKPEAGQIATFTISNLKELKQIL
ncbi:MAG: YjjG family noncanonical pyrimidine nucleotidase [Vicingaceae bacterium]